MGRECYECERYLDGDAYSNNQWRKGPGGSRCMDCVSGRVMRDCAQCGESLDSDEYSSNQWRKGEGYSRCVECVSGPRYQCGTCLRTFNDQNQLDMHMQVHRPRDVACPVCGDRRFRSGANAVQHVESGYCSGCPGRDNARQAIYNFANKQRSMNRYMTNNPQLTYGDWDGQVPDYPYHCPDCSKPFRHASQLLQHQDQKHNNHRLLQY